jgi:hypothetical protein
MRYFLVLFLLTSSTLSFSPAPQVINAPVKPDEIKPTEERPFLKDPPPLPGAFTTVADAIGGDEDELAKIREAGLSYYGALYNPNSAGKPGLLEGARQLGFELARDNKEWIGEMCRWEYTLLRPDTAAVWSEFERLKPRFMNPQTQLMRVMFHARLLGDMAAYEKAAKSAKGSKWVKAARAWFADGMDLKEAIAALLAVADEAVDLQYSDMLLHHSQMGEGKRPNYWSEQAVRLDFKEFTKPESIRKLFQLPQEFGPEALYERIGALALETDDKAFIAEMVAQQRKALEGKTLAPFRLEMLLMAAYADVGKAEGVDAARWRLAAKYSTGPQLAGYVVSVLGGSQSEERLSAGITAFMSQPDITMCQRLFLTGSMMSWDDALSLLAIRGVIALCADQLGAWRNIARALMRITKFGPQRENFRKALLATKQEDLAALAAVMEKGKWEELNPKVRKSITLSPEQQASLLAPFVEETELVTHGGLQAVFWLNKAVFLNGTRAICAAAQCYFECLKCTPAPKEKDSPQPNFGEYARFVSDNCDKAAAAMFAEKFRAFDAAVAERAQIQLADFETNALGRALRQLAVRRVSLDNEQSDELSQHPEKFGGAGLAAAAAGAFADHKFTLRRQLRSKAEQCSPLSYDVHWLQCPFAETPGTSSLCTWELCSRVAMRVFMLRPFAPRSIAMLLSVQISSGQFAFSCAAALGVSMARQPHRLSPGSEEMALVYSLSCNRCVWPVIHATCIYSADVQGGPPEPAALVSALTTSFFGLNTFDRLQWQCMAGANPQYGRVVLEELVGRRNMNDVSTLLDFSRCIARTSPETAIAYIEKADKIGISRYGRFVGTQGFVQAHGQLGTLDKALERYHDMRSDTKVGYPAYLDMFMLAGVLYGNNHKQLGDALEAISGYEPDMDLFDNAFLWRRALMMAGRHDEIEKIELPDPPRTPAYLDAVEYSKLFHAAAALLGAGSFDEVLKRCAPFLAQQCEDGIGVFLDAALLRAIALKASGQPTGFDAKKKTLAIVDGEFCDFVDAGPGLFDGQLAEILCGRREVGALAGGQDGYWHGMFYAERPPAHMGSGRANNDIILARDPFIRGVLAWLANDDAAAREQLQACVKADQRNSHEYHVAQWLLAGPLKK